MSRPVNMRKAKKKYSYGNTTAASHMLLPLNERMARELQEDVEFCEYCHFKTVTRVNARSGKECSSCGAPR